MRSFLQPWNDYNQAIAILTTKKEKFTHLLQSVLLPHCDLLVNIKTEKSFLSKLTRKPANEIHDVLRAAILTNTNQETIDIVFNLKQKIQVVECDHKEVEDVLGYRGSYHLKIKIEGTICEVQVMPKSLWSMKEILHNRYETVREGKPLDKSVRAFSRFMYNTIGKSVE
jgi:hypothetical protein